MSTQLRPISAVAARDRTALEPLARTLEGARNPPASQRSRATWIAPRANTPPRIALRSPIQGRF
uniref:Uncharacterized protein n=1 Tax=Oryza rufipogon TaxID=4529 RepID=A0A0E0NWR7_ORYRU